MSGRLAAILMSLGLGFCLVYLFQSGATSLRLPGNQQGYQPEQPIRFSHRLHAGELEIGCLYCHGGAERSRNAGLPAASLCMNCHKFVTAPLGSVRAEYAAAEKERRPARLIVSPEIQKLYDAVGFNPTQPAAWGARSPIAWNQIYNLPDYVRFDHRPHVTAGVACQSCHGPVETMERVSQVPDLSMGWCVNCHRDATQNGVNGKPAKATLDCAACHY
ncbi:MAG TPA: cytochrome c3 family protein [Terriglobia bacterium]|nr:cytochrome c3 family protein [Terriglobia bacterium]